MHQTLAPAGAGTWIRVAEAAKQVGCSKRHIHTKCHSGELDWKPDPTALNRMLVSAQSVARYAEKLGRS